MVQGCFFKKRNNLSKKKRGRAEARPPGAALDGPEYLSSS